MSPHKHFLNLLKFFAIVAIGFSFAYGENVMAASSNALTVPSETTVNVAADQDSGANIKGSLIIAESTCAAGYTVSVSGGTDNNLYLNGDSTSEYIAPSTGTRLAPTTIIGEGKLNTWGISMSETIDVYSNTFFGLTNEIVPIFSKDSASADGGDQISVRYGASVSADKRAGLYKMSEGNTITYYLTTPVSCHSITIVYDGNGADDGNDMAVQHENVDLGDSLDLYASNYKRAGYGFAGWSIVQLDPNSATFASDLASAASDGLVFGPNETITVNEDIMAYANPETNLLPLYAVWIRSAGNIQDWAGCNVMKEGDVTALTDTRDNNVYTVAKLADGNCWMIENLRLNALNSDDSTKAQGFGGVFAGLANSESVATFSNTTTANSKYSNNGSNDTISIGTSNAAYRLPRYNNTNTQSIASDPVDGTTNLYSYGNYYSFSAALANTNDYTSTTGVVSGKTSETVGTSLCPSGWSLPYGRNTGNGASIGGFSNLDKELGGTGGNSSSSTEPSGEVMSKRWRAFPNNFVFAGFFNTTGNSSSSIGSSGSYLTSTVTSSTTSYVLTLSNSSVSPGTGTNAKYTGSSIRCTLPVMEFTVKFNANGGTGSMGDQVFQRGVVNNLNANEFVAPGTKVFLGWNTAADGSGASYADGASVINPGNITLYAQWRDVYTITFYMADADSINFDGVDYTNGQTTQAIEGQAYKVYGKYATKYGFASWSATAGIFENSNYPVTMYTVFGDAAISLVGQEAITKITEVVASTDPVSSTCQTDPIIPILVYDERDNEAYTIARLCDGNYWMLDNLRLDLSDSTILNGLSVSNTHATEQALSCLKTGYYNGDPCASPYTASAVSGIISVTTGYARAQVESDNQDDTTSVAYGIGSGKVGIYYNYCAASAGSYCYGMSDGVSIDSLESDICPVGWHLPTGQTSGSTEYRNLRSAYSNHSAFLNALSVAFSGYYLFSQTGLNVSGRLWTSTYFNNGQGTSMRRLYVNSSTTSYDASPGTDGISTSDRFVGNSVRCVMDH